MMRTDLLTRDLKIAIVEENLVSLIYSINGRVIPRKTDYVVEIGSISIKVGLGVSKNRQRITGVVDIDPRDHFLAQYPTPFDDTANRLTLAVVKVAVTKLPGVKVIHA